MSATTDIEVLYKRPAESYPYNMDFAPKLDDDETIESVTSWISTPAGLTLGSTSAVGKQAQCRLSAGTDGTKYLQVVVAVTNLGNVVQMEGYLFVRDAAYS